MKTTLLTFIVLSLSFGCSGDGDRDSTRDNRDPSQNSKTSERSEDPNEMSAEDPDDTQNGEGFEGGSDDPENNIDGPEDDGFVEHSGEGWTEFIDCEGPVGDVVTGGSGRFTDAAELTTFTEDGRCRMEILQGGGGTGGWGHWGGVLEFPEHVSVGTLWLSFDLMVPEGFDARANPNLLKFLRLRQTGGSKYDIYKIGDGGMLNWDQRNEVDQMVYGFRVINELVENPAAFGGEPSDHWTHDVWQKYQVEYNFDTDRVRLWMDGRLIVDEDEQELVTGEAEALYMFTYWNSGEEDGTLPSQTQHLFVDNLYLSTQGASANWPN